ncbi:MAG: citryl-CoA lyase [Candidatus Eremiobacteraeota bacterium]|nr:citryl-CoA lyase [Candidatus Eremiobacteraeota bacterium]
MGDNHWKSAVTSIEPNKVLIRGYPIEELMGTISYGQALYLLLKGELPPGSRGKIIDAILLSSVDHGPKAPSCNAAIMAASTGAPINAALSAGILSINQFHGGAIENCMHAILEVEKKMRERSLPLRDAVKELLSEYKSRKERVAGLGHRIHTNDPRTAKLFDLAHQYGLSGKHIEILKAMEEELKSSGKGLPINVDGAIAALLCELEIEPSLANAFFIMSRLPGLLAHVREEKERYKPMRVIDTEDWEYDGPPERHLK